jgi:hypothetical protein
MSGPQPDLAEFSSAVNLARQARAWRQRARMIRSGTTVHGTTLGECLAVARRAETLLRVIAIRAERSAQPTQGAA